MKASDIIGKFRFTRNSDSGGSGGGVSDEVKGSFIKKNVNLRLSGIGYLSETRVNILIDENNCIQTNRGNMGAVAGLAIKQLSVTDDILSVSNGATIDLGISGNTTELDFQTLKVADDKSFVIFCNTAISKFFYIPLNKSGNTYTFGTPITLDTDGPVVKVQIIDSNTFAAYIYQSGSIQNTSIIKLSEGTLSIDKLLNENGKVSAMESIENVLFIVTGSKAIAYDVVTGNVLYEDSSYQPAHSLIKVKNKILVSRDSSTSLFYALEVNQNGVEKINLSSDSNITPTPGVWGRLVKGIDDNNYLVIFHCNLAGVGPERGYPYEAFIFDLVNNKLIKVNIKDNYYITSSTGNNGAVLTEISGSLILGWTYQNNQAVAKFDILNNRTVSLKYKNDIYEISSIGE